MTRPTWLAPDFPALQARVIEVARDAIGICEDPLGSNRAPEIDAYLKRLGVPLANPWCAAAVAQWFHDAGAATPPGPGACSCDTWMAWAKEHKLWTSTPAPGYAVVYGKPDPLDAQHIGVIARLTPLSLSIEGNRGFGTATREGVAVDLGPTVLTWVLGYVRPVAA